MRAAVTSLVVFLTLAAVGCSAAGDSSPDAPVEEIERTLRAYFDAIMTQNARSLDTLTTEGFLLVQNGHRIDRDRFVETWVEGQPLQTRYRQEGVEIEVHDSNAVAELELGWYENRSPVQREAIVGLFHRDGDRWKVHRMHSVTVPLGQPADTASLDDYVGSYSVQDYTVDVKRRGGLLVTSRPGQMKWVGGLTEAELLPGGVDQFYLEVTNSLVEFERDAEGAVIRLYLYEPFSNRGFPLEKVR
jgi:hypothetical protein